MLTTNPVSSQGQEPPADGAYPGIVKPDFAPEGTTGGPDTIIRAVLRRMIAAGYPEKAQSEFMGRTLKATNHMELLEAASHYVNIVRGEA